MNKQSFVFVLVAAVVLGAVFYLTRPDYQKTAEKVRVNLFADNLAEKVARIKVEKGEEAIEIAVHDNRWSLPERDNYPADSGKVNSFILKFFSLAVSQRVTNNTEKHEKFGLTDDAVKGGKSLVSFFDSSDALIGKVYLGERRKGNTPEMSPNMPFAGGMGGTGGQYLRRGGEAEVYLSDQPLAVQTTLRNWLDQSVVNVLGANADRVEHYAVSEGGEELAYALDRLWMDDPSAPSKRTSKWVMENQGEQKVDDASVSLVSTGLQNLRMDDVYKEGSDAVKDLVFDMRTKYYLANGLRYDVSSATKDEKTYVKIAIAFDADYAEQLKLKKEKEIEEAKAKAEAAKAAREKAEAANAEQTEGEEAVAVAEKAEEIIEEVPVVPPLALVNAEEATKRNYRYEAWVYVLPDYLGKKFRQDASLIVNQPEASNESSEAPAAAPEAVQES
jgi:hypothetical protein